MRHTKRIFAILLSLAMILTMSIAMSATAFAATDGSVTVSNKTSGKTYTAYKVFSATYTNDNPQKVAYFYDGSNATFLANLQADNSPFTLTGPVNGVYNVIRKTGKQDSDIIDFLKANKDNFGSGTTKNGNGGSLVFDGLDYGYYYITTTNGTAVTIDSALKDVTVIDKNQGSTLDKQEKIANGTWSYDDSNVDGHKVENPVPTANVGDTVSYKVTGSFTQYQGETKVVAFRFKDTMSAGLTADKNVVIKVKSTGDTEFRTLTASDYTVNYSADTACVTTITVPTVDNKGDFIYGSVTEYEITYSAKVNDAAVTRDEENNTVDLDYTANNTDWTDVDQDETKVKDYKITLTKQETGSATKLAGAKFKLYDAETGGNEIPLVLVTGEGKGDGTKDATVNNVYRHAKEGETGVEIVTSQTGIVEILGLANGNYYFEETEAPAGYNKLTARTEVTTINNADGTITVNNATGTELPSTGGIGTVIFYVLGSLLVVGCGIVLISKRRTNSTK